MKRHKDLQKITINFSPKVTILTWELLHCPRPPFFQDVHAILHHVEEPGNHVHCVGILAWTGKCMRDRQRSTTSSSSLEEERACRFGICLGLSFPVFVTFGVDVSVHGRFITLQESFDLEEF